MQREFVPVPIGFTGHVIGKDGHVINDIRQKSGAQVRSPIGSNEEGFTVSGNAEQIACAKRLILEKVVSKTVFVLGSISCHGVILFNISYFSHNFIREIKFLCYVDYNPVTGQD